MLRVLTLAIALNVCTGIVNTNEEKPYKIDTITIASQNDTNNNTFDQNLQSNLIQIDNLKENNNDVDLKNGVSDGVAEGRDKPRDRIRHALAPLFVALKFLATVLPAFMMFVTILALKGFLAGTAGLFLSKLVALKLLLDSQEKNGNDHEEEQEEDDEEEESQDQEHSAPEVVYESGQWNPHERKDNGKPFVVYWHSNKPKRRFSKRIPSHIRRYHLKG